MSYIGSQPADSYLALSKQDFTTSATTTYTLSNSVTSSSDIALFINFVRQEPETAYTASGVNLNLTEATSASDDMYCIYLGRTVGTINPPNGSVGTAQIADDAITPAKLSALANPFASQLLHVQDQKSSGNGGASSVGFQTRDLNTILTNEITGASLSSNQITLPAGTYYIDAEVPGYRCTRHNAHLNNDTDSRIEVVGTPQYTAEASDVTNCSFINGRFTISAQKNFSITHYFDLANANGYGISTGNSELSIFTNVRIWRTA